MPTQPRLKAIEKLHPVVDWGIEEIKIFRKDTNRTGRISFLNPEPYSRKGISGSGGGAVPGGNDIGGSRGGLFGGTA
jgi:hypothetical protein